MHKIATKTLLLNVYMLTYMWGNQYKIMLHKITMYTPRKQGPHWTSLQSQLSIHSKQQMGSPNHDYNEISNILP